MKLMKLTLHAVAIVLAALCPITAFAQRPQPSNTTSSGVIAPVTPVRSPINLPQLADLQIVKSVGVVPHGGSGGTFVIVVTNNGPGQAAGPIVINDTMTGPATIVGPAPTGFVCTGIPGTAVTCTSAGSLNAGQSLTLTFNTSANPGASGMAQNCATVRSNSKDNNDSNNRDCTCMDFKKCFGTTIDISTGSNNGNAIPIGANDSHWNVVPPSGGSAPAIAIVQQATTWIPAPAGTQWISSSATATDVGTYAYTLNFNLGNDWPNRNCTLSLQWAADNDLVLKLGSTQIATSISSSSFNSFNTLHNVTVPVTPSTGLHTITANVFNSGGPTGLLVSGKVICSCGRGTGPSTGNTTSTQQ